MATVIQANVIDVSAPQTVKTARGSYQFIEVAYKKDGKVEGKKVMDFGHPLAKDVFNFVKGVKSGDVINITLEKVNDFWTWVGVEKEGNSNGETAPVLVAQVPTTNTGASSKAGRVVGSNYENSEERATRQRLIVRQSSLTAALNLTLHNGSKAQVDPIIVMRQAEQFVDWVFEHKTGVTALAAMKDDIPV